MNYQFVCNLACTNIISSIQICICQTEIKQSRSIRNIWKQQCNINGWY